ncbi:MAG: hypothetical protein GY909_16845 [Oligoflexia bacterium]|nr:hypothetical protein [Oligoflexia bacterium]
MIKSFFKIFLTISVMLLLTMELAVADDQLVIIQAVSNSKRTFAVRRGQIHGVINGQESLFTNNSASFSATAVEVSREFSVWEIKDKRGSIPFEKGDFVTVSRSIENIWTEIPKTHLLPPKELNFKPSSEWLVRGTYSFAMSESVSETESTRYTGRTGVQLEILYTNRFAINWEYGVGLRFDRENSRLQNDQIDIPTQRNLIVADLTYHFENFKRSDNNAYLGIGFGYGLSSTTVDESVATGKALIAPVVRLGYINRIAASYALLLEGSVEAVSASESFENTDTQQSNVVSSKISVGLRF